MAERAAQDVAVEPEDPSEKVETSSEESAGAESSERGENETSVDAGEPKPAQQSTVLTDELAEPAGSDASVATEAQADESETPEPYFDDLTVIDGIGHGLHSRLKEYGVLTFADLAGLDTTAAVNLGTHLELEDPETVANWVAQAKGFLS